MSYFRIPRAARTDFFKNLTEKLRLDFDIYYICLMAGLACPSCRKEPPPSDVSDLVDYFPGVYKPKGKLIVALLLARELELAGVRSQDRVAVHRVVSQLVSTSSLTYLSDEGVREMNRFAYGGYLQLIHSFEQRPESLAEFLPAYKRLIDEWIATSSSSTVAI